MIKKLFLYLPLSLFALNDQPWLGNTFEWVLDASYGYTSYQPLDPSQKNLYINLWKGGFSIPFSPYWEFGVEGEVVKTLYQNLGWRSMGSQVRYQWLDDNLGDAVSFVTGLSVRKVSKTSLHDATSPYHSTFNVELNGSIGGQWEGVCPLRGSVVSGLGIADRGFPWFRMVGRLELDLQEKHQIAVFLNIYMGLGNKEMDLRNFHEGYGQIGHRSVDLGFSYTYVEKIWGRCSFTYKRGIYGKFFPKKGDSFMLEYFLPFSLF